MYLVLVLVLICIFVLLYSSVFLVLLSNYVERHCNHLALTILPKTSDETSLQSHNNNTFAEI